MGAMEVRLSVHSIIFIFIKKSYKIYMLKYKN